MSKTYSPKEVAEAVLKRCKDMLLESKITKSESCEDEAKEEVKEHEKKMHDKKKKEIEKCGDMKKSSKLKEFVKNKKKTDLKKMFGRPATTGEGGSVAPPPPPAPGTSIADKIGFGKKEDMEKRCWEGYKPVKGKKPFSEGSCEKKSEDVEKCGDMKKDEGMSVEEAVSAILGDKHGVNDVMSKLPKEQRSKVLSALRQKDTKKAEMCKGWMDKSEEVEKCGDMKKEEVAAKKAVGLKPLVSDKVQAPKSDEMPKEPKAATTLKSFMTKRKK